MIRFFLIFFLCQTFCLQSEVSSSLESLIKQVLTSNPDLAATHKRIEAAEFEEKRVQILEDPEFIFLRHTQPFSGSNPKSFRPKTRYTVLQEIPFPGTLSLKGKIEGQQVAFLKSENLATEKDLILQTKKLFFELYYNKMAIKINEENQKAISTLKKTTSQLHDNDKERFSEAVEGQIETRKLDNDSLKLVATTNRILGMIATLLNQENLAQSVSLDPIFTPTQSFNQDYLEMLSTQNSPEIKALESQVEGQKLRADLARKECFPNFLVGTRIDHNLGSNDTAWGVTVGINIPLWIPWKQKRDKQKALALADAFRDDLIGLKASLRGQIKQALITLKELDRRISLHKDETIPKAKLRLKTEKELYQSGKGLFINTQNAIQNYYSHLLNYELLIVEREILLAELERIIGTDT
jgi:outer membrane protein, heavy metal efflux system